MDFNNGLYVFNGVPGLESSKGERIAKALQNLLTKIKRLEQVRNSEREMSSKSGSTDTEDITLSDVQLKLLSLQLQNTKFMCRSTRNAGTDSTADKSKPQYEPSETECTEIQNCCKETQTGMSLHEIMPTTMPQSAASHAEDTHTCTACEPTLPVNEATSNFDAINSHKQLPSENAPSFDAINSHKQLSRDSDQPSSKDVPLHYHFKIDDVPFILGTSASDSHNLIANLQCLFANLKTHLKPLCGSRVQASQNRPSSSVEKSSQETKSFQERVLGEISKDLTEIQIIQAKLQERFENQNSDLNGNQVKDSPHYEKEVNQKQTKKPSNTGSTINNTTVAVRLKEKKKLKSTRVIKKNKHVVPTNRIRMNLPQVARQRLLRSIREVRTHLSEEDISWV